MEHIFLTGLRVSAAGETYYIYFLFFYFFSSATTFKELLINDRIFQLKCSYFSFDSPDVSAVIREAC